MNVFPFQLNFFRKNGNQLILIRFLISKGHSETSEEDINY